MLWSHLLRTYDDHYHAASILKTGPDDGIWFLQNFILHKLTPEGELEWSTYNPMPALYHQGIEMFVDESANCLLVFLFYDNPRVFQFDRNGFLRWELRPPTGPFGPFAGISFQDDVFYLATSYQFGEYRRKSLEPLDLPPIQVEMEEDLEGGALLRFENPSGGPVYWLRKEVRIPGATENEYWAPSVVEQPGLYSVQFQHGVHLVTTPGVWLERIFYFIDYQMTPAGFEIEINKSPNLQVQIERSIDLTNWAGVGWMGRAQRTGIFKDAPIRVRRFYRIRVEE
jgi:hypothetical protein